MLTPDYPRIIPVGPNAGRRKKLSLYMYIKSEALLPIIETSRLRLSKPWQTNDITECVMQNENALREYTKLFGYLCFSERCDSPAMWGYYADRGYGACLEYEFDVIEIEEGVYEILFDSMISLCKPIYLKKVSYSNERTPQGDIYSAFFTKSKEWEHEKEYRIVVPLSDNRVSVESVENDGHLKLNHYISGFGNNLSRVILGPYSLYEVSEISSLIKQLIVSRNLYYTRTSYTSGRYKVQKLQHLARVLVSKSRLDPINFDISLEQWTPHAFNIDYILCYSYSVLYQMRESTERKCALKIDTAFRRVGLGDILDSGAVFKVEISDGTEDIYSVWRIDSAPTEESSYVLIKETEDDLLYVLPSITNLAELLMEANHKTKEVDSHGEAIVDKYVPHIFPFPKLPTCDKGSDSE